MTPRHIDRAVVRAIVTDRSLAALCLFSSPQAYGFSSNIPCLPSSLARVHGFRATELGLVAGLPLVLSAVADLVGGVTTDRLVRRFGLRVGRCGVGAAAL